MIDQYRSSLPENQDPYGSNNPSEKTSRDRGVNKKRPAGHVDITAMVRSLQRTAGTTDCFRMGNADCDILDCDWRTFCLGKPADQKKNGRQPEPE